MQRGACDRVPPSFLVCLSRESRASFMLSWIPQARRTTKMQKVSKSVTRFNRRYDKTLEGFFIFGFGANRLVSRGASGWNHVLWHRCSRAGGKASPTSSHLLALCDFLCRALERALRPHGSELSFQHAGSLNARTGFACGGLRLERGFLC